MRVLLLALLLWLPQAESGEFTISVDGSAVGNEEFSILRNGSGFVATGSTSLRIGGESVEAESRMQLDSAFNPVSYEYRSGDRTLRMAIAGEVATIEIAVDGEASSYDVRFPEGGMIVDDNFFHHYVLLFNRVGTDGGEIDVFVPQQLTTGRLEIEEAGEWTYDLTTENLRLRARTDGSGRLVRLAGLDSTVVVER